MRNSDRPELVRMFVRGHPIADCAKFFGVRELTAEKILREAVKGLAELNVRLQHEAARQVEREPDPVTIEFAS